MSLVTRWFHVLRRMKPCALSETAIRAVRQTTQSTACRRTITDPVAGGSFQLRQMHKPGGKTFDLDPARRRQIKQYEADMIEGELMLTSLSREAGGNIWLPESL